jgi:sporulation protein YlmC with PRC-barrel domain
MKTLSNIRFVKRSALTTSLKLAMSLCLAPPLFAAAATQTPAAPDSTPSAKGPVDAKQAQKCASDLHDFSSQMQKDGYWFEGASEGYGYPMYGYNYDETKSMGSLGAERPLATAGYWRARPGYEVRTLLASANILAQRGQQQDCEGLLSVTREVYGRYATQLRNGKIPHVQTSSWQQRQLASAQPISSGTSYRSDQLIGTDVLNPQGDGLGSVTDLVMSPATGQIAYLVVGRGGVFGIDEKYVPVPWGDFKATTGTNLLVLDSTKAVMDGAPRVREDQFSVKGDFADQSSKIDDYWKSHSAK